MIGALIGDLAAWTYEHEQDTFWKQLIPNGGRGAEPSVYGHALLRAASKNILDVPRQDVSFIRTIPTSVSNAKNILSNEAESQKNSVPISKVPMAPNPVQIMYAVLTGIVL